jgi:hypothetical protein
MQLRDAAEIFFPAITMVGPGNETSMNDAPECQRIAPAPIG